MHDNERIALFSEQAHPGASKTPTLDQMGIDLTAQARQGKLSPVIGRDKDLERVIQVLSRSPSPRTGIRKHHIVNPLLVFSFTPPYWPCAFSPDSDPSRAFNRT